MARFLGRELNWSGHETRYHKEDGKTVIEDVQDVEPILEANKRAVANESDYSRFGKSEFRRVASIPMVIVHKWLKEGIDVFNKDHWPKVRAKLLDPDNLYLRTTRAKF